MRRIKFIVAKCLKRLLNPPALRSCNIDKRATVCSGSELNFVKLGKYSYVGNRCFMVNTNIGCFCSIADRCSIGGAMHPIERVSSSPVFHSGQNVMKENFVEFPRMKTPETIIENDVWIGMGCYVKAGVIIHNGAVVGMGSIVTHDIPPYEIWAGNPGKRIGKRFDENQVERLLVTQWWKWPDEQIRNKAHLFNSIDVFLEENPETRK